MDRETYKKAVAEVILFDNTDVITTSGGGPGGGSWYCTTNFDGPGDNTCKKVSAAAQQ